MKSSSGIPNLSPEQLDGLLKLASKKLSISPDDLKKQLQNGSVPKGIATDNVAQYLNDPKKLEQFFNSPSAKQMLKNLTGNQR